ncbi:class I SAM-dependent RNA methyltransferase [Candidatus Saccharibacteria bacterium]|nr:class I SAM-dependent RNA methyltransferase [Candidatus Saccharibacteria bacterium]
MPKKDYSPLKATAEKIVGGGHALATLETGQKAFIWNALPGETVKFNITKKKSNYVEGIATTIYASSNERIAPLDPDSYLSTSPWQIMTFEAEQHYKAALIEEAFELHNIVLPSPIGMYTDGVTTHYRNKVEFSWYGTTDASTGVDTLDLAFFRRGSKGKIIITQCSLLQDPIMRLALSIRDVLRQKNVSARPLKTLLLRCNQQGECTWQLYIKANEIYIDEHEAATLPAIGGEVIYSNPKSPASRITLRLAKYGTTTLADTILDTPFRYATEGFFQVNIPVYEQSLRDMKQWVTNERVVDLYSGVGSIGLTIGGPYVTLVEINEDAVREMQANITELGRNTTATAVLAASEHALDYIASDSCVIVDPPRAGLHSDVITRLLQVAPQRIIYLSCNPVTQARDIALLSEKYGIRAHRGYNFFPRTPHIEHLIVLDRRIHS